MIEAIQRFIAVLRKAGLRVSPAEAIEAARAVQAVGVERREVFRLALKTTLCKTRGDAGSFDRAFDSFFAGPAAVRTQKRGGRGAVPSFPGEGGRRRSSPPAVEPAPGAGLPRSPVEDRGRRTRPGRLKILAASARALPQGRPGKPEDRGARRAPAPRGARRSVPFRPMRPPPAGPTAGVAPDPRRIDLSIRLARSEEERIAREVPRVIREIRLRAGRRYRRGGTGRLWSARLMRENVGTGGVPFVLPFRRRRPRRPRVIVLVDVSWSVMRASALFLMMAREFLEAGPRASIYFFVDRCVEATGVVARWKGPASLPFERLLDAVAGLDPKAASDYGRAFYQAIHASRGALRYGGRDTILVVLGDARSNDRDPQAWAFEDLAARCRRVIWLNPEPMARWNTGDSGIGEYLPHCDVVCEAADLLGIARGVKEIARSL